MRKNFNEDKQFDKSQTELNEEKKSSSNNSKRSSRKRRGGGKANSKTDASWNSNRKQDNDISWYAKNKQLLASAASLSYFTPMGASQNLGSQPIPASNPKPPTLSINLGHVTGIMALEYIHGPAADLAMDSDPLDIAANNIYAYVRHMNSGGKNYDAPDLMMYLLAMDELYQAWAVGVRAYGLMRLYSQTNRYIPKTLIHAAGFNFEDLQGNLANFNHLLNVLAAEISAFCIPADISYFRRHFWLPSNVYVDEEVLKPQLYLHRPALYRVWSDTASDQGSSLVPRWWKYHLPFANSAGANASKYAPGSTGPDTLTPTLLTVSDYAAVMNTMLSALQGSSDVGLMSGDIKKAYGDGNLFTLSPIPSDYTVLPVKSEEVLSQISNFRAVPGFNKFDTDDDFVNSLGITQYVGTELDVPQILYKPTNTDLRGLYGLTPNLLNLHKSDVSPEDTMIASRWLNLMQQVSVTDGFQYSFRSVGSEFGSAIVTFDIWDSETMTAGLAERENAYDSFSGINAPIVEQFDWHPPIFSVSGDASSETPMVTAMQLDLANFTFPGEQAVSNMNQTAILSMFNVPQLGSF